MANCDRCSGALDECACLQLAAGSEKCLRCGQGRPLPKPGTTRPVPHKDRECLVIIQATIEDLRARVAELEAERDGHVKMLRMGESCSLETVVRELVAMGRICKDAHDSDAHGWEVREHALRVGEEWLAHLASTPKEGE